MDNSFSIDNISEDNIHTEIACKIKEPQQKYRHGTVSNRLLGGLNMFNWTKTLQSACALVQSYHTFATTSTDYHKTINIFFTYFPFFYFF